MPSFEEESLYTNDRTIPDLETNELF